MAEADKCQNLAEQVRFQVLSLRTEEEPANITLLYCFFPWL